VYVCVCVCKMCPHVSSNVNTCTHTLSYTHTLLQPKSLSVLQLLCTEQQLDLVTFLLRLGLSMRHESRNALGRTALHIACAASPPSLGCVRALVRHGALVSVPDNEKNTPLHLAGSIACAEVLVEYGAALGAKNSSKIKAVDAVLVVRVCVYVCVCVCGSISCFSSVNAYTLPHHTLLVLHPHYTPTTHNTPTQHY
jgi:hypothetical protein